MDEIFRVAVVRVVLWYLKAIVCKESSWSFFQVELLDSSKRKITCSFSQQANAFF